MYLWRFPLYSPVFDAHNGCLYFSDPERHCVRRPAGVHGVPAVDADCHASSKSSAAGQEQWCYSSYQYRTGTVNRKQALDRTRIKY